MTQTGEGRGRPARWAVAAAVVAVAVVATGTTVALTRDRGASPAAGAAPPPAGVPAARMCGVVDPGRFAALAADAPAVEPHALVPDLAAAGGGEPAGLEAVGDRVATLAHGDGGSVVTTWSASGAAERTVTIAGAPGVFTLSPDGAVIAPTGSAAGTDVGSWTDGADPDVVWDLADAGEGAVVDVLPFTAGERGVVAAVAFERSRTLGLLHADGTVSDGPELAWDSFPRFFVQPDGTLFVLSDADDESSYTTLTQYDADGDVLLQVGGRMTEESDNGRPLVMDHPSGVAPAPDGDGFLVFGPTWRIVEIGPDGVWRGVALSERGEGSTFRMAAQSPLRRVGDGYVFLSETAEGTVQLTRVTAPEMQALLDAPITWSTAVSAATDKLGFGAGLATDAVYDYFPDGEQPRVHATFDPWWGAVSGDYELRYEVSGDPWAQPAIAPVSGTVALPADGGDVALDLPPARPGPYEVHATLVEKATGDARAATCLRYAVGAPGATFDPAGLADGADWGGAGPLRGVQLADELGLGVHRVQLDFAGMVPEDATPSVAALDLGAIPGAEDDDPFAGLAAAAREAVDRGVLLYVQIGEQDDRAQRAVADGTWGAWVAAIVSAVHAGAPDVTLWAPWNEPNNTGISGADYARQILAPVADAVHRTDPRARVIGGNALNVVVPWYADAVAAGACASWDVVGIHPYTGFNRSWDEEGAQGPLGQIAELRDVLSACGDDVEVWNTESGWWSDGPANQWQQAYDVARTSLWQSALGVGAWMYFFSEGGWGEAENSWSLLQVRSYVKPGALAMATVGPLLEGRPAAQPAPVEDPTVRAVTVGAAPGTDEDPLLAVWTLDALTDVALLADADATVTVTDVYGATRTVDVVGGEATTFRVTGSPQLLAAPASTGLRVAALDGGADLLAGGTVTASSTSAGDAAALVAPEGALATPWRAGPSTADGPDVRPWVRVDLAEPATLDRVVVESAGIRCCTAGLKDAVVEVEHDGAWTEVGRVEGAFLERTHTVRFDPVEATAVRVTVPTTTQRDVTIPSANYGGQTGGLLPAWEPVHAEPTWPVSLVSLAAYGPGRAP